MASDPPTDEGKVPTLHRAWTLPFMATDLSVTPTPAHRYRHDLESFFYILIWAAVHYDLKKKENWTTDIRAVGAVAKSISKSTMLGHGNIRVRTMEGILKVVGREFQELRTQWISLLYDLFRKAFPSIPDPIDPEFSTYDRATCNGPFTFGTLWLR